MEPFINVHCHLVNFGFVPDSFFKTRAGVRERLLRGRFTRWLARVISFVLNLGRGQDKKYDKLHEALDLLGMEIEGVADALVEEMAMRDYGKAEIVLATPLMMDLEPACLNVKPEVPYRYQILLVSRIAARHPGRLMPFIMVDPRRPAAFDLTRTALEEMGFLGVKLYPPLGYHPDPASFANEREVNRELARLYEYCEALEVPITTHCSRGGAYGEELVRCRRAAHEFCQPSSWEGVLRKHRRLRLNFAHFGSREGEPGSGTFLSRYDEDSWCSAILRLMSEYENVYADLAYHDDALRGKSCNAYFCNLEETLNDPLVERRVLFGTDWLMTRHTWTEGQYVRAFMKLRKECRDRVVFENPLDFLFPGRKMPGRLTRFYGSNGLELPQWMRGKLTV
jgi:predicted TIM-barrel fold metal-dependent hydrolase